jgi:penicillin-insensitive murein endopeptidase
MAVRSVGFCSSGQTATGSRCCFARLGAWLLCAVVSGTGITDTATAAEPEAKHLFGNITEPAALAPQAVGGYARGCVAGAVALPPDGPHHQTMRLGRNRNWGHPALVTYLEDLSRTVHERTGWPGILVGDMAQPRGGPMLSGHASHQIGLDADIWLMPSPPRRFSHEEREKVSAVSVLLPGERKVDPARWSADHYELVKAAAEDARVARVFVNPAIKRTLCGTAGDDRPWLRKVRAWYGHDDHIHVRLGCPEGNGTCRNQALPPPGDGCGAELDWWFTEAPYRKPDKPAKPKPGMYMSDLPRACQAIYAAE